MTEQNDTPIDKNRRQVMVGDIIRVFHFTARSRKRKVFMYKAVVKVNEKLEICGDGNYWYAVERLRMVASDPGACVYKYLVDESLSYGQNMATCMRQGEMDRAAVIAAYLQETDPTPIDEAFARRVAVEVTTAGFGYLSFGVGLSDRCGEVRLMRSPSGLWRMFCGSGIIDNPTIGDFFTAVRLFRVQLKEGV